MHFFNPRIVAEKLRDGLLSERQKLRYLIGGLVLTLVSQTLQTQSSSPSWGMYFLVVIFYLFVSCFGLKNCFATNERGDNKLFIERWLCLTLPISMWTGVLPACLSYALFLLSANLSAFLSPGLVSVVFQFIDMGSLVLYFMLLNRYIRVAASGPLLAGQPVFAPIAAP